MIANKISIFVKDKRDKINLKHMKRKLLSIITAVAALLLIYSCGSDDPTPTPPATFANNNQVLTLMERNYFWNLPANPDTTLNTPAFFASLLNPADSYTDVDGKKYTYSSIFEASKMSTSSVDIGFEYSANRYQDGIIYYVILYVKPNTSAATEELMRGYLISKVNDQAITAENQGYLIAREAAKGTVKLQVLNPETGKYLDFNVRPANNYVENPVYTSPNTTPILTVGNKKVGYLVYNMFASGNNGQFDKTLMDKLQSFVNGGAEYLVLDLRYNTGGKEEVAAALASATVNNRNIADVFMYFIGRTKEVPNNFMNQTKSTNIAIPTLGNQLKQVYVITSRNTKGLAEGFIYSLKSYLGSNLVVVGEKTLGLTMATATAFTPNNEWFLKMAIGKYCNKDKKADYTNGIDPTTKVTDLDLNTNVMLKPLGDPQERVLKEVLNLIKGQPANRSTYDEGQAGRTFGSSLQEKFRNNMNSGIELQ